MSEVKVQERKNSELSWERLVKARGTLIWVTLASGIFIMPVSLWFQMAFTPIWFLLIGVFLASSISVMVLNRLVD